MPESAPSGPSTWGGKRPRAAAAGTRRPRILFETLPPCTTCSQAAGAVDLPDRSVVGHLHMLDVLGGAHRRVPGLEPAGEGIRAMLVGIDPAVVEHEAVGEVQRAALRGGQGDDRRLQPGHVVDGQRVVVVEPGGEQPGRRPRRGGVAGGRRVAQELAQRARPAAAREQRGEIGGEGVHPPAGLDAVAEFLRRLDVEIDHPLEALLGLGGDRGQAIALEQLEPLGEPPRAQPDAAFAAGSRQVEPGHDDMREIAASRHSDVLDTQTDSSGADMPPGGGKSNRPW